MVPPPATTASAHAATASPFAEDPAREEEARGYGADVGVRRARVTRHDVERHAELGDASTRGVRVPRVELHEAAHEVLGALVRCRRPQDVGGLAGAHAHDGHRTGRELVEGSADHADHHLEPLVQRRTRTLVVVVFPGSLGGIAGLLITYASTSLVERSRLAAIDPPRRGEAGR